MPQKIETLEAAIEEIHEQMSDPEFYREAENRVATLKSSLAQLEEELESSFNRWQELEAIAPD